MNKTLRNIGFAPLARVAIAIVAISLVGACDKQDKRLEIEPASFDLTYKRQSVTTAVASSSEWMCYSDAKWLECVWVNAGEMKISATENSELAPREGTVTVINGDAVQTNVIVRQSAPERQ